MAKQSPSSRGGRGVEDTIWRETAPLGELCRNNKPFLLPEGLNRASLAGEVVVFAGAEVSTESNSVFPQTFREEICDKLGIESNEDLAFPDLSDNACVPNAMGAASC